MAGSVFILLVALSAIAADFITPYEYQAQDLERYREGRAPRTCSAPTRTGVMS